jgi:hypothetical protein
MHDVKKSAPAPTALPLWIQTDSLGSIHDLAPESASLLGLSARGACARDVRLFFPAAYGPLSMLMRDAQHRPVEGIYFLYPRSRKPVRVHVRISPASEPPSEVLEWELELP